MGKVHCAFEDDDFDGEEFDAFGRHLNAKPPHLLTGDLLASSDRSSGPLYSQPPGRD